MEDFDLVVSYSRADAIADGTLVDVSELAKEARIKFPVAITEALQNMIEDKPEHEDIEGRTWDVVWMLRCAITGAIPARKVGESIIFYELILNSSSWKPDEAQKMTTLKALVHGGDNLEPVITVMLPSED